MRQRHVLVLASASLARRRMLENAGLALAVEAAGLDEEQVKKEAQGKGWTDEHLTCELARRKALAVAERHPGQLVLGADQILDCMGRNLNKPTSLAEAREQLSLLRGREHRLVSAAVLVRDGVELWHAVDKARLRMRAFSEAFLDSYLGEIGERALSTVGAYEIEGPGAQLFDSVEGDHFTIQGLPLLPLLEALRGMGVLTQ
jgi:septum formation protein